MAVFGNIEVIKEQVDFGKFKNAFEYLDKVLKTDSLDHKRLVSLPIGAFEKVELDSDNFGVEQVYMSKKREDCFFESHKKCIDVQFILEGEEIIEVTDKDNLNVSMPYSGEMDLIKYEMTDNASVIKLKKGDVAIFYPEDAHMPCVKINSSVKVVKTVVKVAV